MNMKKKRRHSLTEVCIVPVLAGAVALSSCSPKIVERVRTEYVYRDRVQVDTTFVHDSIHVRETVKGDTVRIVEYRDRYHYDYKYITRTDTLTVRDSVAVEHIKEVKVETPLSAWKRTKIRAFWWLVAAVTALAAWTFRRPLRRLVTGLVTRLRL